MCHKHIRIPKDNADYILLKLGALHDSMEFVDLTKDDVEARKNFGQMLHRCEEMNKKINELENICNEFHQPLNEYENYQDFSQDFEKDFKNRAQSSLSNYFDLIEAEIMESDRSIKELVDSHTQIRDDLVTLIEKKHVLMKTNQLISSNMEYQRDFGEVSADENGIKHSGANINFMAGVVNANEELKMKRMIFRVSRGRALSTFYNLLIDKEEYLFTTSIKQRGFSFAEGQQSQDVQEPLIGEQGEQLISTSNQNENGIQNLAVKNLINIKPVNQSYSNSQKKIFNIIFQGGEENILLNKILKVCEIFQVSRYHVPPSSQIQDEIRNIETEIRDKKDLLIKTEMNLKDILIKTISLDQNKTSKYALYKLFFIQAKIIYNTLNKCILNNTILDGEVWIPKIYLDRVTSILNNISLENQDKLTASLRDIGDLDKTMPPTFFQTNSFFSTFQTIVSTYGIPRYREINPAYFTVITFPFLFGVMFGDIGHGLIVFIFACYLCLNSNKIEKSDSLLKYALSFKYLLLLMGFFSTFCGFMYNDFLSIPLDFKRCFEPKAENSTETQRIANCQNYFGFDPVWYNSSNELAFINSFKMKLSVIIGVTHMSFGIILKGVNLIFEKKIWDFILVFIPEIVLMLILFGYMDFLIFVKWSTDYSGGKESTAPDIKSILLNIFLKPFESIQYPLWGSEGQMEHFHKIILLTVLLCILVMLIPKTIIDYSKAKKKYNNSLLGINDDVLQGDLLLDDDHDMQQDKPPAKVESEPKLSDFIVNSLISTIEFVLGGISNTASYLRLWALSLAHSQLSHVCFDKLLCLFLNMTNNFFVNTLMSAYLYIIFAYITIGVLLLMDFMECFLHTLRLHWVEFQDKFFYADGYEFKPFNFGKSIFEQKNSGI